MRDHNIGAHDRTLRVVISLVLLPAGIVLLELHGEVAAIASAASGLVVLVTAITRRSPLYATLRMSTLQLTRVSVG